MYISAPQAKQRIQEGGDIPEMKVYGDLHLKGLEGVAALPRRMSVHRHLSIIGAHDLESLPESLTVSGNLSIIDCPKLVRFPRELRVGGHLMTSLCPSVREIDCVMEVRATASLYGLSSLESFTGFIRVGLDLYLNSPVPCRECPVRILPDTVLVGRDMRLGSCPIESMPRRLQVGRDFEASHCGSLEILRSIEVGRNIDLSHCEKLVSLPEGLRVHGNLDLSWCRALQRLPNGLVVSGDLLLPYCSSLEALPTVETGGDIVLSDCWRLASLPEGLIVLGNLNLEDCEALERLPEKLVVTGNLRAEHCPALVRLPAGLTVGGNLVLSGSTALQELPEGLVVAGVLDIRVTRIERLPSLSHVPAVLAGGTPKEDDLPQTHPVSLGWEEILERFGRSGYRAEILDADPDELIGTLLGLRLPGAAPAFLLKVRCATLPRYHILRVPPHCTSAYEANAWTWGLQPREYAPAEEA